ncbi:uncharacterized protein LOC132197985 [Neocloeon triangulifer]|uniref:uncharacterized protein LOC132197985 n=1 Tax=Neocloeon triangulifer TaxID=2078957 RepID=UPI00286EBEE2|nr:uncharacterized protein LOC132197985 [Neocloeon triangulifer]
MEAFLSGKSALLLAACLASISWSAEGSNLCNGNLAGHQGKYTWGDALTDSPDCIGPTGSPYPKSQIARMFGKSRTNDGLWTGSSRSGRGMFGSTPVMEPHTTRKALLKAYEITKGNSPSDTTRSGRGSSNLFSSPAAKEACGYSMPGRLCKTRYNTTAPMYGVSLTSGQPVTIVQKFPDLLQQVVFEVCESSECAVIQGECTQTYVPYLFLVIPLGPVTLTGQDYVLVESGCTCRPKFGAPATDEGLGSIPPLPNFP